MDSKRWNQFKQLVDGVIARVGEREVINATFSFGDGDIHLTHEAFESLCGQRVISQKFHDGNNHRHFMVGSYFRVFCVYLMPQPRPVTANGEYVQLCGELGPDDPTDIISDREACDVLGQHSVIAAEAVSDG